MFKLKALTDLRDALKIHSIVNDYGISDTLNKHLQSK